jgi:hypothetical protein
VPPSPFEAATSWLKLLNTGGAAEIAAATALPFTYATTAGKAKGKAATCEGAVKTQAALVAWLACLRKAEAFLLAELSVEGEPAAQEGGTTSAKLGALMKKVAPAKAWVSAFTSRDGVRYDFRFLVDGTRVAALLLDRGPEPG